MMAAFGEAGQVLRMILLIAQRLSQTERTAFLQECISNASDDTMAFRILTVLTKQEGDSNLAVSVGELYSSFAMRMRKRYGQQRRRGEFRSERIRPVGPRLLGS